MTAWLLLDLIKSALLSQGAEILGFILLKLLYLSVNSDELIHILLVVRGESVKKVRLNPVPVSSAAVVRSFTSEKVPQ